MGQYYGVEEVEEHGAFCNWFSSVFLDVLPDICD